MQDNVGYLPTINAPATEMSTVNEVLTQTLNIMSTLELKAIVWVFDQVLYVKAAEITRKHDKFNNIIIFRMGAFHTIRSETTYIDHREWVSGCWPPRRVCGSCHVFRRIHHSCDGMAQIQSCCQASQVPIVLRLYVKVNFERLLSYHYVTTSRLPMQ